MSIKKKRFVDDFDKSAQIYYKELTNFKSLSKNEENDLWMRYKYHNDIAARNKILESNLKFVASIAKSYKGRGLSYSELVAEGNMGLIKALDKFDETRGNKIISYSVWWIRQSILDAIEKRKANVVEDYPEDYEEQLDDEQTNQKAQTQPDAFIEEEKSDVDVKKLTTNLIDVLDQREKQVISSYFGLFDYEQKTLEEIGKCYGLTKERIRQITEKALKKMRTAALNNSAYSTIYN